MKKNKIEDLNNNIEDKKIIQDKTKKILELTIELMIWI